MSKPKTTPAKELAALKAEMGKLSKALQDPGYRNGWISNLAMAQLDAERWYRKDNNKVGKYLSYQDRHTIANLGAKYFLDLLTKPAARDKGDDMLS